MPRFSAADRKRFAIIKDELSLRLPRARPCSEEVYCCALLFAEVRERGYQQIDGHAEVEPWMDQVYGVRARQALTYRHAALLTPEEVRGKRQGIEVMGQIGQEQDPLVRAAMWELAEAEGLPAESLRAGRMGARPYLAQGRREQGIAALQRAARSHAEEAAKEKAERERTPRTDLELGQEEMTRVARRLGRMEAGKAPVGLDGARAILRQIDGLREQALRLVERCGGEAGPPQSRTAEGAPPAPPVVPRPATEIAPPAAPAPTRPALQVAAEVLPYQPLLSFFHEELRPDLQQRVQEALCGVVRGDDPGRRVRELWGGLRPCLRAGHPAKRLMAQASARLRGGGLPARLFALDLLLAARLPGMAEWLDGLANSSLPPDLHDLVHCCCELVT